MQPVTCPICRAPTWPGQLCANCGALVPYLQYPVPPTLPSLPPPNTGFGTNGKIILGCFGLGALGILLLIGMIAILQSGKPSPPAAKQSDVISGQAATEGSPSASQPSPQSIPANHGNHQPIGVSYATAMTGLTHTFQMKRVGPIDGYDHFLGQAATNLTLLETIGGRSNISSAALAFAVPNDNYSAVLEQVALITQFLKNLVPEWPGAVDWVSSALRQSAHADMSLTNTIGHKAVKVISKKSGMFLISVEHS
jgi:hypothetical protein